MRADSDVYLLMLSACLHCGPGVVPQALIDRCMRLDEAARKAMRASDDQPQELSSRESALLVAFVVGGA